MPRILENWEMRDLIMLNSDLVEGGCWIWTKHPSPQGYGQIRVSGRSYGAHVISYIAFEEKLVPPGMKVCHTCDNRLCVAPSHLWIGTNSDNMRDAQRKGRKAIAKPKIKTERKNAKPVWLMLESREASSAKPES